MKVIAREHVEDIIKDQADFSILDENIICMPQPYKFVYINGNISRTKIAFMTKYKPICFPFKVGNYTICLNYNY